MNMLIRYLSIKNLEKQFPLLICVTSRLLDTPIFLETLTLLGWQVFPK